LAVKAISQRDYPVILAITLLSGACVMIVNLLVDIFYAIADPRVSLS
jgi:peptide/nickel transport system permease protein